MTIKAYDLRINFQDNFLMDKSEQIYFSWKLKSLEKGTGQQAYRIVLKLGDCEVWNSGKVHSKETINVKYGGARLHPEKKYSWKIYVTATDDSVYESSEQYFFTFSRWTSAEWITTHKKVDFPVFTSSFKSDDSQKKVVDALLYITALGTYNVNVNNQDLKSFYKDTTEILNPGWTDYRHQINYQCYDISEYLLPDNEIAVSIGNGWFLGKISVNSGS